MNSRFYNEDRQTTSLPPSTTVAGGRTRRPSTWPKALKPDSAQPAGEAACTGLERGAHRVHGGEPRQVRWGTTALRCEDRQNPSEALWINDTCTKCTCCPDVYQVKQSQERGRGWGGGAGQLCEVMEGAQLGVRQTEPSRCHSAGHSVRPRTPNGGSNSHLCFLMRKH